MFRKSVFADHSGTDASAVALLTFLRIFFFVFCNSAFADRIVLTASRLFGAAAVCIILSSFAAGHRKSYWNGCIQAAIIICQQICSILALVIFLLKSLLKSASKSSFFCFGVEIHSVLELQILMPLRIVFFVFCNSAFADRIVLTASRLFGAAAVCIILSSFAAGHIGVAASRLQ